MLLQSNANANAMMKGYTLFLDRDGVINERLPGDYVRRWADFRFIDGVLGALKFFAGYFGRIVIVTNQQGVGKGLMGVADLEAVHRQMLRAIAAAGGRIDGIYYCPDLAVKPGNCRKPAPAMALHAQRDFPEIDFPRAVMVGDTASDMAFGRGLNMRTVWIEGTAETPEGISDVVELADFRFESLAAFARALR
jgi:D-glycero-D-manno-heptose 1,7-bisphosphate phosphatase